MSMTFEFGSRSPVGSLNVLHSTVMDPLSVYLTEATYSAMVSGLPCTKYRLTCISGEVCNHSFDFPCVTDYKLWYIGYNEPEFDVAPDGLGTIDLNSVLNCLNEIERLVICNLVTAFESSEVLRGVIRSVASDIALYSQGDR